MRDQLGELHGIDEALALCKRVDDLNDTALLQQQQTDNIDGVSQGDDHAIYESLDIHLGTTHSFTVQQLVYEKVLDQGNAMLDTIPGIVSAALDWGVQEVIGTTVRTLPVVGGDPAGLEKLSNSYESQVAHILQGISGDFAHFGTFWNWEGEAARTFNQDFYSQFAQIRSNHADLAATLASAVAVIAKDVDLAQQSLLALLQGLGKGLDQQLQQRHDSHQSTGASAADWLNFAFVVTGVLAAALTDGVAVPALVGASTIFAYSATRADGEKTETVEAQYASEFVAYADKHSSELVAQWTKAMDQLDSQVIEPQRTLVASQQQDGLFDPPRLALGSYEKSFQHVHEQRG